MASSLTSGVADDAGGLLVITDGALVPLAASAERTWSAALSSLVEQEVHGRREGPVPPRVAQLLERLGFGWEPAAAPGHMRFLPKAAAMLARASRHAEATAERHARRLGLPLDRVDGVGIVDRSSPLLREYYELVEREPDLYGTAPYRLAPPDEALLLRQTACVQKYSIARDWDLSRAGLPRCIYELSDSYRREPERDLQLCFRVRRFRLPEAHLHAWSLAEATELALALHGLIADDLEQRTSEYAMLITASHAFARRNERFLLSLAARAGRPALVRVCAPDATCRDGVEVDVEYKFVDADGCARELSTFQIDERITRSFGLGAPEAPIATIHAVLTGSVERSIFAALDRVAVAEASGRRAFLPLWLSPIAARLAWRGHGAPDWEELDRIADALERHGLAAEVEDRPLSHDEQAASAADDLVPFLVEVGAPTAGDVRVRALDSGELRATSLERFIEDATGAAERAASAGSRVGRRVSTQAVWRTPAMQPEPVPR